MKQKRILFAILAPSLAITLACGAAAAAAPPTFDATKAALAMQGTALALQLTEVAVSTAVPADSATAPANSTGAIHLAADGSGDYPTLEAAVDALDAGGTITLDAGTYALSGSLLVTKPLTLRGAGMDQTVLTGSVGPAVLALKGAGPFVLEGITFEYQGTDWSRVVQVTDGEISIQDCRFTGGVTDEAKSNGGSGLQTYGSTTGTVKDSRADHNQLSGFILRDQTNLTLDGNVFTNNGESGVAYFEQASGTMQDNESSHNGLHGFSMNDQAHPELVHNVCSANEQAGMRFSDDSSGTARMNTCDSNGLSGIIVRSTAHPTLLDNTLTHNGEAGIGYFGDAAGTATGNTCTGNKWGIDLEANSNPTLSNNTLDGNTSANLNDLR